MIRGKKDSVGMGAKRWTWKVEGGKWTVGWDGQNDSTAQ